MKHKDIDAFEKVRAQLEGLHIEIGALSKKSHNDAINTFKLGFVNQVLVEANKVLGKDYKPFPTFQVFDANDLPTNSDVELILSQYLACFDKYHSDNAEYSYGTWYWKIDGKLSGIETTKPTMRKDK